MICFPKNVWLWKIVLFICNLLKKLMEKIRKNSNEFETIRKTSWLKIRNSIRFEGKIIRFVRFEKFSIRLIRKYIFNSKNSRKINSKFVRFDSTPPLPDDIFDYFWQFTSNQQSLAKNLKSQLCCFNEL